MPGVRGPPRALEALGFLDVLRWILSIFEHLSKNSRTLFSKKFQGTRDFSRTFCKFSRTFCKFPGHSANFHNISSPGIFFPKFHNIPKHLWTRGNPDIYNPPPHTHIYFTTTLVKSNGTRRFFCFSGFSVNADTIIQNRWVMCSFSTDVWLWDATPARHYQETNCVPGVPDMIQVTYETWHSNSL